MQLMSPQCQYLHGGLQTGLERSRARDLSDYLWFKKKSRMCIQLNLFENWSTKNPKSPQPYRSVPLRRTTSNSNLRTKFKSRSHHLGVVRIYQFVSPGTLSRCYKIRTASDVLVCLRGRQSVVIVVSAFERDDHRSSVALFVVVVFAFERDNHGISVALLLARRDHSSVYRSSNDYGVGGAESGESKGCGNLHFTDSLRHER